MEIQKKLSLGVLLFVLIGLTQTLSGRNSSAVPGNGDRFTINLRARSMILGPNITLGDIGTIVIADSSKRAKISAIEIGKAAPPGESTEISLSSVKKKLMHAGFGRYVNTVKGPRTIRVLTAQTEIDKAFVKEGLAHRTKIRRGEENIRKNYS